MTTSKLSWQVLEEVTKPAQQRRGCGPGAVQNTVSWDTATVKKIERPHIIHKSMLGESAAVMVACGIHHMLVLTARKVVWSCGWGHYSQLCHDDKEDHEKLTQNILANIAMVACGGTYSMAVDTQGQLFSWGDNNDDQLGHNDFTNITLPKMLPSEAFAGDAVRVGVCGKISCRSSDNKRNSICVGK